MDANSQNSRQFIHRKNVNMFKFVVTRRMHTAVDLFWMLHNLLHSSWYIQYSLVPIASSSGHTYVLSKQSSFEIDESFPRLIKSLIRELDQGYQIFCRFRNIESICAWQATTVASQNWPLVASCQDLFTYSVTLLPSVTIAIISHVHKTSAVTQYTDSAHMRNFTSATSPFSQFLRWGLGRRLYSIASNQSFNSRFCLASWEKRTVKQTQPDVYTEP